MPKPRKIKITSDDDARRGDAPSSAKEKTAPESAAETQQRAEQFNLEQRVSEAERRAEEANKKYQQALADLESSRRRAPSAPAEKTTEQAAAEAQQRTEFLKLEQRVAESERRAEEINEKYLRALADLENFRRRARQERAEAVRAGESAILLEVLPVLDNFSRAMEAAEGATDVEALVKGIKMIHDQLADALARKGVRPIRAEGEPFDPAYHDAVGKIETADRPEGTVAVEIQKGYMLGGRVLRPSRVMVAARPAEGADTEQDAPPKES
jgi:molecular chaperone GrpE